MPGCTAERWPSNGTVTSIVVWDGPGVEAHCLTAFAGSFGKNGIASQ